jgi:uncharacterized membrane protein
LCVPRQEAHIKGKGKVMAETSGGNLSPAPVERPREAQHSGLRTAVMICYVLYLVAFINGLTAIIGVIIAHIKKPDAVGTVWESHFRNLILTFWVMFAALIVGLATLPISLVSLSALFENDFAWPALSALAYPLLIWMLIFPLLFIWFLYRVIRGLIRAADDRSY